MNVQNQNVKIPYRQSNKSLIQSKYSRNWSIELNTVLGIVNILLDLNIGGQILKWANNLKSIFDKNTSGNCPFCNSINTDYSMHIIDDKTNMGYGVIWCNDCKNAFHISRIKVSPNMKNILVPEGLKY